MKQTHKLLKYSDRYIDGHIYDLMDIQEFFEGRYITCCCCKTSVKAVYKNKRVIGKETPFEPCQDGWRYFPELSKWCCSSCCDTVSQFFDFIEPYIEKFDLTIF